MGDIQDNHIYDYPYNFLGAFYIHKHVNHIGLMGGGSPNDIYSAFEGYKQNQVSQALKTQYASLTQEVMAGDIDPNIKSLLSYGSDPNARDTFLTSLDEVVKEGLQEMVNTQEINQVLSKVKKINIVEGKEKVTSNFQKLGKQLNQMLTLLQEALELFRNNGESILITIDEQNSLSGYESALRDAITKIKKRVQRSAFRLNIKQIRHTIDKMDTILDMLDTGKSKSGKELTFNVLKHAFNQYVFSTGLGEAIAFRGMADAQSTVFDVIHKASLSGADQTRLKLYDENGVEKKGGPEQKSALTYGKADILFPYTEFTIEDYPGKIVMNIGVSNKLYKTASFRYGAETLSGEFSLGGGLTLEQGLYQAFGNNQRRLYLAYNLFGWQNDPSIQTALINLQDIIFTRNIITLFGSRGGRIDFASYILLNGKIVSLWEVILYALDNNIGISHSLQASGKTEQKGISFSIGDKDSHEAMTAFQKYLESWSIARRSFSVKDAISKSKMTAHIRPNKLAASVSKT